MKSAPEGTRAAELFSLFEAAEWLSMSTRKTPPFELALQLLDRHVESVSFVQVGANDGSGDLLGQYIAGGKWTGVMVEPHPEAFSELSHRYKDAGDRLTLVNKAITLEPGEVDLLEPQTNYGSRTSTIVADSGWARSSPIKRSFRVEGIPLRMLLSQCHVYRVDLLQIDVEGYDFEALLSLDFSSVRPSLIRYEDRHFFPPRKRSEAVHFLRNLGYKVLPGLPPDDTLAIDEAAFCSFLGGPIQVTAGFPIRRAAKI